ncbi:ABC transporter permease [Olsenella sp. YH-ols2217]|uniref:Transport permease protein n=1 Tax=Kribbibacterium absianum TaxID=3044210 RepID=A0ABT6ZND2_9ACTN|nr:MULTISPECIES: ABC transporter permease [unclassified Olsenella]MDJ1122010.1 ABC transporter permease [Olsenella sp. YH-ols2216]MDJ1130018.1 ABC transporter permease [Olsenella sp. YH-ols2217]
MATTEEQRLTYQQATWNTGAKRDIAVLQELVRKDFKLKYRRSVLGIVWSVLNPLLMMLVMAVVFTHFMRGADMPANVYPVYLIIGNITFGLMSSATSDGMWSIINAAPLLKKVRVNRLVFPVEKVLFAVVNFALSLIAVALVMLVCQVPLGWQAIFLVPFLVYFLVFCIGLSLLLATLAVFFRDVIHLWGVVTTAWMYATPIFYTLDLLPATLQGLMKWNPLYQYVDYFRTCVLYQQVPSLEANVMCVLMAVVMLAIGLLVFRKNEHKFILFI